ncbi:thioesterase family protein [Mycolicibacterium neoaurum]|uniref:acyl-CoA thioesterase n=1 Tax=Mycolicibacterium neoaurum TaxID=1795 RepID=UPI0026718B6A|nr:acyl-CoA thioesterase domain-containing protein [Mycolicibacterium neoaurum]MDO3402723.1 thioesterase family protein [Mycolicibacterium neoaurum]
MADTTAAGTRLGLLNHQRPGNAPVRHTGDVTECSATPLQDVLNILCVEQIEADVFLGHHAGTQRERVFGGQIAAQALMAAAKTSPHRVPNSLHAAFLHMGDTFSPVRYHVTSLADGRNFTRRRVTAVQNNKTILEAYLSLAAARHGSVYQIAPPTAPPPETLERIERQLAPYADEHDGWWVRARPFDIRYVTAPPRIALDRELPTDRRNRLWIRPDGAVPEDAVLSTGLITYLSDLTLLDPVMISTRRTSRGPGLIASLDHSIWFHRSADLNDWILYDQTSPTCSAGRGLSTGSLFNRAGDLVCTVAQEGYVR